MKAIGLMLGGVAIAGAAVIAGCSPTTEKPAEPGSTAVPSATEKSLNPGSPNSFTPTAKAHPPGTVAPGRHHHGGVG